MLVTARRTAFVVALLSAGCLASGQQPVAASRLLAYGTTTGWRGTFNLIPTSYSIFEVDPGSGDGIALPVAPPPPRTLSVPALSTFDPNGRRLIVYHIDEQAGASSATTGQLYVIDPDTGQVIHSTSTSNGLVHMEYERTTDRLLAMEDDLITNRVVEVDIPTGLLIQLGAAPLVQGAVLTFPHSAIDSTQNRYLFRYGLGFCVVDTLTGTKLIDAPLTLFDNWTHPHYDASTGELLAIAPNGGLASVDQVTGIATLKPTAYPVYFGQWIHAPNAVTVDEDRGLFHTMLEVYNASQLFSQLFTFDTATGAIISDAGFSDYPYVFLEMDPIPATRGRVTPRPSNRMSPGSTRTVHFEVPTTVSAAYYVPLVSCTPGSSLVPGTGLTVPLGMDGCTLTYVFDDLVRSALMPLVPGGSLVGTLSPFGSAIGSLALPASAPPSLGFDLHVGLLTIDGALQRTGPHGSCVIHVGT